MFKFDFSTLQHQLIMVLISILIGLIIGVEREYRNKSAGLRTFVLISFGACVFTILSIEIGIANPDRLAANIITGIGFLGAGVIFKEDNKISGITTATTIWAAASLGMAAGSGHIYLAIFGVIIVMVILNLLAPLQDYIDNEHKIRAYKLSTNDLEDCEYCIGLFKENHLKYKLTGQEKKNDIICTTWDITGKDKDHQQLIAAIQANDKITAYQF